MHAEEGKWRSGEQERGRAVRKVKWSENMLDLGLRLPSAFGHVDAKYFYKKHIDVVHLLVLAETSLAEPANDSGKDA